MESTLVSIMSSNDISISRLAKVSGLTRRTITNFQYNKVAPRLSTSVAIMKGLSILHVPGKQMFDMWTNGLNEYQKESVCEKIYAFSHSRRERLNNLLQMNGGSRFFFYQIYSSNRKVSLEYRNNNNRNIAFDGNFMVECGVQGLQFNAINFDFMVNSSKVKQFQVKDNISRVVKTLKEYCMEIGFKRMEFHFLCQNARYEPEAIYVKDNGLVKEEYVWYVIQKMGFLPDYNKRILYLDIEN